MTKKSVVIVFFIIFSLTFGVVAVLEVIDCSNNKYSLAELDMCSVQEPAYLMIALYSLIVSLILTVFIHTVASFVKQIKRRRSLPLQEDSSEDN